MKRRISILSSLALGGIMVLNNAVDVNAAPMLNPYNGLEAEVNFGQSGTKVIDDNGGQVVSSIEAGDYFIVKDVNFSKGVSQFKVKAKADKASWVEIREGGIDGEVIAQVRVSDTEGEYKEIVTASSKNLEGKTSIAFIGKVGSCSIDKWAVTEYEDKADTSKDSKDNNKDNKEKKDNDSASTGSTKSNDSNGLSDADKAAGKTGPGPMIDPYEEVSTNISFGKTSGTETVDYNDKKVISSLEADDYFVVDNVDFKSGVITFNTYIKADKDSTVEIREGGPEGELIGMIKVKPTNGEYKSFISNVKNLEGIHAIAFVGKTGDVSIEKWNAMSAPKKKTDADAGNTGSSTDPGKQDNKETTTPSTGSDLSDADKSAGKTGRGPMVNPYDAVSTGVSFGESSGTEIANVNGKKVTTGIEKGDYFVVNNVSFNNGVSKFYATVSAKETSCIEVREGGPKGKLLGLLKINPSSDGSYKEVFVPSNENLDGVHAIAFIGKMGNASIAEWHVEAAGAQDKDTGKKDTDNKGKDNTGNNQGTTNPRTTTPTPTPTPTPQPGKDTDKKTEPSTEKTAPGPMVNPYDSVPTGLNFGKTEGVEIIDHDGKKIVSDLGEGDYFVVNNVNFDKGIVTLNALIKSEKEAIIEVRDGSLDGDLLGTIRVTGTDGEYKTFVTKMKNVEGVHALVFVGKKGNVRFDSWKALCEPSKKPGPGANNGSTTTTPQPGDNQGTTTPTPQPGNNQGTTTPTPAPQPGDNQGTTAPTPAPQPGDNQGTQKPKKSGLKLSHAVNDWGCGHLIDFRVSNNSGKTTDGWKLKIKKDNINIAQSWCVDIKEEGDYYVITPLFWNSQINDGNFVQFGIIGVGRGPQSISYKFE
ncbi:MAG: carbohydrate-binding protein [Butyrivibrio sp.]|nr:carbohydrate-binding protein [Butyrivibrio sp.]